MSRSRVGFAIVVALLIGGGVAAAQSRADKALAHTHFERGSRAYAEGRYDEAVDELTRGYDLDPRPDFLYALGQAERQRGHCDAATSWYRQFLATNPSPQRRAAAQLQIDRCEQEEAAAKAAAPPPPPAVVEPTPEPAPPPPAPVVAATPPPSPERTPVYKKWWLWTIVGVVVAGAGVGVAVALTERPSFSPTLPDLVIMKSALQVRF